MRFGILGELIVTGGRGSQRISSARQRVILSLLLLEANRVVPVDRLIQGLWDDEPPDTARSQIHICVSGLRRSLLTAGVANALRTRAPGYLMEVADDELDLHLFDRLTAAARGAVAAGRLDEAGRHYDEALRLWRGEAFTGVDGATVRAAARALGERRLAVLEESLELRLRQGRHHEVIEELMTTVAAYPLRERPRALLMTSLCRDGRAVEALEVYRQGRKTFVEELGMEPGEALRRLERDILAGDPRLQPARLGGPAPDTDGQRQPRPGKGDADRPPAPAEPEPSGTATAPCLLPADSADFTGRETLLEQLRETLLPGDRSAPPVVVALSGRGGVGKTIAAIHAAHQLTGRFPDGQLFAALRGGTAHPLQPSKVLERFLRVLGVPEEMIPDSQEGRAELYRHRLAGCRVLVVLDNATSEDQVMPLLPGTGTSAVIVTSRRRLTGLPGAHRIDLGLLPAGPALELLTKIIGEPRVAAEPEAARTLVGYCGGLPLALRVAAARAAAKPHWTLRRLASRMRDERHRLDELVSGGSGIRWSIAGAGAELPETASRLLRRLGLPQAPDFGAWVAAPLLGADPDEAEDALETLVDARLVDVEQTSARAPRYHLHDLVRAYARERLAAEDPAAERRAGLHRLMGAWLCLADEAHRRAAGGGVPLPGDAERWPLPTATVRDALADPASWLEWEGAALAATVRHAAQAELDEACWELAYTAVSLPGGRHRGEELRSALHEALAAVRRAGNRRGEAAVTCALGMLSRAGNRWDEAVELIEEALRSFVKLGDEAGAAMAERLLTQTPGAGSLTAH